MEKMNKMSKWTVVGIGATILGFIATLIGNKAEGEGRKAEIGAAVEAAVDARFKGLSESAVDVSDEEEEAE